MRVLATTVLTVHTLINVVVSALAAGIGVTVAFSALIYCADRASELRRVHRSGPALAMTVGGLVALAACVALVVYGLILVASKGK
jgi:hypothetical protein